MRGLVASRRRQHADEEMVAGIFLRGLCSLAIGMFSAVNLHREIDFDFPVTAQRLPGEVVIRS
jgi:hypothetical protein